jgi:hypothetical protein
VLVDSLPLYAWQHTLLRGLAQSNWAELAVIAVAEPQARATHLEPLRTTASNTVDALLRWPLQQVFKLLEAKIDCPQDAFADADAAALLMDTKLVHLSSIHELSRVEELSDATEVDLFIELGASTLPRELSAMSRNGVWRLSYPFLSGSDPSMAAFWPIYHRWPVTECRVVSRGSDSMHHAVIARAFPATNPYSVKLNRSALYWRGASVLASKLRQLQLGRQSHSPLSADSTPPDSDSIDRGQLGSPSSGQLAGHIGRNIARRARESIARNLTVDQWVLLFCLDQELATDPSTFQKIVPPKDRFWADPHVVKRDGRYFVFFEECPFTTGIGHIAVLAIDEQGRYEPPTTVLKRNYHLSYPFVFEQDGELFMVPESEANRTIDLYRCVDFPAKWELVTTLMRDIAAVDSTLLYEQGKWWLFATVVDMKGASSSEELFLFHSDSLFGKWLPHAGNPILSDARRSRPAGAIMRRNGRLYRPAQDCSIRYGHAIRINEITALSPDAYSEVEVSTIFPDWDPGIIATHTLSYAPGITVIDGLQQRRRF